MEATDQGGNRDGPNNSVLLQNCFGSSIRGSQAEVGPLECMFRCMLQTPSRGCSSKFPLKGTWNFVMQFSNYENTIYLKKYMF